MNRMTLTALLLCSTMLAGCAGASAVKTGVTEPKSAEQAAKDMTPTDLDGGVRQAQLLRTAGDYAGAVRVLSQLMLVAADDPRVVSEYGKTLAQQGRAKDAIPFLNRAAELRPSDPTVYSAMGVAFDQIGDSKSAANAYEHALQLRPADPAVLNNYALSRMLANDPDGAARLMERARIAGGADNAQIARNMAMIKAMTPQKADAPAPLAYNVSKPAPAPTPVVARAAANAPAPFVNIPQSAPQPSGAPRPLMPQPVPPQMSQAAPVQSRIAQQVRDNRVVMQRVPEDPLAGPIALHPTKKMMAAAAKAEGHAKAEAKPVPVKAAAVVAPALPPLPNDKTKAVAKADAKPDTKVDAKPAPVVKAAAVVAPPLPPLPSDKTKAVAKLDMKPEPAAAQAQGAPKVLDAKPVKVADAKKKDEVPSLRLAAGAY